MEIKVKNTNSVYQAGQLWSFFSKNGENDGTFIILKIEKLRCENIIHIAVIDDVNYPCHMPFSEQAIDKSVGKLLECNVDIPDVKEGYNYWLENYKDHKAGIYSISIADVLELD